MSNSFFPRGLSSNDLEIQCASTFVLHPLSTRLPGHCSRKRNGWTFMQGLFTALGSKKKKKKKSLPITFHWSEVVDGSINGKMVGSVISCVHRK